jgi:hypothetical protein
MLIKVIGKYEIYVDNNRDHEARLFIKNYVNPKKPDDVVPQYRSIGHYGNVKNAVMGIYNDICIKKGENKIVLH